ncbi:MAG TPA: STAS domain-containing protein [Solirubrobacterales bacterium]|jgi:anti-anti-sigma factor
MAPRLAELDVSEPSENAVVISLSGEVDDSNAGQIMRAIADGVPASVSRLILDLSDTRYLDSSGVEVIFNLARDLSARRQELELVVPEKSGVRRVLELCDVTSVAPMHRTLDEAQA